MGDGTRLAIAIAFIFAAGVAFFFAFHPMGVGGTSVDNADSALQWLMQEYQITATDSAGTAADAGGAGATPTTNVNQPGAIPGVTPPAEPGVTAPGFGGSGGQIPGVNAEPTGPSVLWQLYRNKGYQSPISYPALNHGM
jgi:hypothetical protein